MRKRRKGFLGGLSGVQGLPRQNVVQTQPKMFIEDTFGIICFFPAFLGKKKIALFCEYMYILGIKNM